MVGYGWSRMGNGGEGWRRLGKVGEGWICFTKVENGGEGLKCWRRLEG